MINTFDKADIYALRRANADWFAFDSRGRLTVPLFHSSHDALMTRLHNVGMLPFNPVTLDVELLKQIVPAGSEGDVDFVMVTDPSASLNRGAPVGHTVLTTRVQQSVKA